ncbi:DUF3656 domain-containing U32 family peptidase [Carboxydothermus pertinax]|uniref:Peptidase U32 collagenase domain-containing protein n=1 Tax=Carboxydothermus pertinax TaxID=870242 RepID=A0A1L8CUP5_9THEO|nr:U32 family peptidase [Carboxydothermus pertinax]GAV22638.1 hypothetical protein cpu_11480 [Carboxydothermus pertinax]
MFKKPELLAPVGAYENLVAAVQNGADAVYFGGKFFNARHFSENFTDEEIVKAINYCHLRGVKAYITLNTLVTDSELKEVFRFLQNIYKEGADAVIVQDLGLAKVIREYFPDLNIHASTQMTLHNSKAISLIKELGIKRVVLARELSLVEIREIKKKTGVELEHFIHGALCISYSGQCLMSSIIGQRSGNRGKCAQPCRLPYKLIKDEKEIGENLGEYLLSTRDINLSAYLPDLIKAGVDSFKIEGRMKRPEYVATVVKVYRELIDFYFNDPQNFHVSEEQDRKLREIFNRNFSTSYLLGKPGQELMSYNRPNNRGVFVGRVLRYDERKNMVRVKLEDRLEEGDGVEIWVKKGGRLGVEVGSLYRGKEKVERAEKGDIVEFYFPERVSGQDRVFKTSSRKLLEEARESFVREREIKKFQLKADVIARRGEPLRLIITDGFGHRVEVESEYVIETACKRPASLEFLQEQLNRLGNTPFFIDEIVAEGLEEGVMIPASELNKLRREAIEKLADKIIKEYKRKPIREKLILPESRKQKQNFFKLAVKVGSTEAAISALRAGADIVYLAGERFFKKPYKYDEIFLAQKGTQEIWLHTPRITKDHELELFLQEISKGYNFSGILAGNPGIISYAKNLGFNLAADYSFNVFNSLSEEVLYDWSLKRATISLELSFKMLKETARFAEMAKEAVVFGDVPLMVSEYCVIGAVAGGMTREKNCGRVCYFGDYYLKDRLGVRFPVKTDQFCRMHIFNNKKLNILKNLSEFTELLGIEYLRLELPFEEPDRVSKVVNIWREEITRLNQLGEWYEPEIKSMESLQSLYPEGFTTGHYFRGAE